MVNRIFTSDDYNEFAGLSTDEKPTRFIGVGSIFVEADTGTGFFSQHLHTSKGTNAVEVTANVEPVELEVVYAKEG